MRKNVLLAAIAFAASMLFVSPVTWAEGCPDKSQSLGSEEKRECAQACKAEIGHERQQAGEHACNQAEMDAHSASVGKVMDSYFAIMATLSQNSMDNVGDNAKTLAENADEIIKQCAGCKGDGDKACSMTPMAGVSAAAKSLAEKTDIELARTEFATLSEKLVELQGKRGGDSGELHIYKCEMAQKVWIQENEVPGNPYFGPSMAMCKCKRQLNPASRR